MNELNLFSKCIVSTSETNQDFVGIQYTENDVKVIFPLGYEIPKNDDDCRISILTLLRTISLSKSIINEEVKLNDQLKEDYAFPISAYLWIIKDYFNHGIYKSNEKIVKKINGGKINWKKTLQQQPLFDENGVTFLNMYTAHNVSIDDIITQIHIICLNESIKHIGWLFGNFELKETTFNITNKEYLTNILNKTLLNTNDDRKQQLILNLRNVLLGLDVINDETSINNYGVNGFQNVWEIVVARLFGNKDITEYKPVSSISLVHESYPYKKTPLRIDSLVVKEDVYYILDAKYHKFGIEMNPSYAPETTEVEKQIVYGEYVDLKTNEKHNIYNAFVIPYNKYANKYHNRYNKNIDYMGYAQSNWKKYEKGNMKPYYLISMILVDCKFALDNWVYNDVKEFVDALVLQIEAVRPELERYGWTELPMMSY